MISEEKDNTVFLTSCYFNNIGSRVLFGGRVPVNGAPSEASRPPCPSRTARARGPRSLAQAAQCSA
eukprot:5457527-Pyramimonas_sp.AAC.1